MGTKTRVRTSYQFLCVFFHTCRLFPNRYIRISLSSFLCAYIADTYWGRFKTIGLASFFTLVGQVIFIISAVLVTVDKDGAIVAFVVASFIKDLGFCQLTTNIFPLVAEQYERTKLFVIITNGGERVIVDPALTVSRVYMVSCPRVTYLRTPQRINQ